MLLEQKDAHIKATDATFNHEQGRVETLFHYGCEGRSGVAMLRAIKSQPKCFGLSRLTPSNDVATLDCKSLLNVKQIR